MSKFCELSGLYINKSKLEVKLSPNMSGKFKKMVGNILGYKIVDKLLKYLGGIRINP